MKTNSKFVLFLLLVGMIASSAHLEFAQSVYGTIVGTVQDSTGAVIPGASITITNEGTGEKRSLTTDNLGYFFANNLLPGQHSVQAESRGFKTVVRSGIAVEVGQTTLANFTLQVGKQTETIGVTAAAPLLNSQTSELGQVVNQQQMTTLPLTGSSGRSFFDLVALSAGVTTQPGVGGFALDNMRINGGRPRADDYLLDGTSIQQVVFGGPSISPPVDSVEEFNVETNSYPAEYGRVSGGIINAISRSGTNSYHGTAYEFLRNDVLDARNFFLPAGAKKDTLRQNEFGFAAGGPIRKDKLFIFGDYQGFRRRLGQVFSGIQVPTAAMKSGNFSALLGPSIGTDACGRPILQGQLYDPSTTRVAAIGDPTCALGSGGQTVRDPFAGNIVPQIDFSQAATSFLPLWPDPISGTGFASTTRAVDNINRFDIRADYNLRDSDKIFFVFHFQKSEDFPASPLPDARAASTQFTKDPARTGTLAWNHIFNPTTINAFRFGFTRRHPSRVPGGYGTVGPSDFGIPGFPSCPLPDSNSKCGTPIIGIPGFQGLSGGTMLFEPAGIYQYTDSVSMVKGRHNIKFGADIRHFYINNIQPNSQDGSFSFSPAETGLPGVNGTGFAFASFLLGRVDNGSAQYQKDFFATRTNSWGFYVQDDYKVTPRLTLNVGIRYQLDLAWKSPLKQAANFNIRTLQWELNGINAPATGFNNDLNNWGPRLGFAWSVRPTLVIRGAYGLLYPGNTTRGRGGDLNPSPLLLVGTNYLQSQNIVLDSLPPVNTTVGDPTAILAANAPFSQYEDRTQQQQDVQQWNLGIEKQFMEDFVLNATYAGSKGTHLPGNFFYNYFQLTEQQVQAAAAAGTVSSLGSMDSPAGPAGNGNIGWVFPLFNMVSNSEYHSLEVKAQKRFSKGFSFLGSYTYSKLIDDASSDWSTFGGLDVQGQDFFNRRQDRSVSAGDIHHRFVVSYIYQLPFGANKRWASSWPLKQVVGGWELSGITTLQTGFPFGVVDECFGFCNYARAWATRPFITGKTRLPGGQQNLSEWINVKAYDFSNYFDATRPFGNAPRYDDHARGPGIHNFDFALIKDTPISKLGDRGSVQFRAEFFNLFNTPQFNDPVAGSFETNFGAVTSTRLPNREVQFGLKLIF